MNKADFIDFYEKSQHKLEAYLLKLLQNKNLSEDFTQECFLKFIRHCPDHLELEKWQSYLFRIGRNLVFDYFRRQRLFLNYELKELNKTTPRYQYIDEDLEFNSDFDIIMKALKPKERELIWLAYMEDLTHREISEITGLKEKSVKVVLSRIRKKMQQYAYEHQLTFGEQDEKN